MIEQKPGWLTGKVWSSLLSNFFIFFRNQLKDSHLNAVARRSVHGAGPKNVRAHTLETLAHEFSAECQVGFVRILRSKGNVPAKLNLPGAGDQNNV